MNLINKKKWFLIILIGILFISALPRSIEFLSGNFVFGYDQGKHWLAAQSIIMDHKFPLIGDEVGGRGGFFQGSGWFYLLSIPYALFQGNPYGEIVLMFLLGVGMIALFAYLFRPILGDKQTLFVSSIIAMEPILISNSRFAWPPFIVPFISVVYLFSVYKLISKDYRFTFLLYFSIGLMAHFEIASSGTLLIATSILFAFYAVKMRIPLKYIAAGVLGFAIPLTPLMLFDLRHQFLNLKGVLATFSGSKRIVSSWDEYFLIVLNHWVIFREEFYRAFQLKYMFKPLIGVYMGVGSLMYIFDAKNKMVLRKFAGFLLVLPFVLFGAFLLYKNDMWPWWITELSITWGVLGGMVTWYLLHKKPVIFPLITLIVLTQMGLSYTWLTFNSFQKELDDYGGVHKVKGKTDALDAIYKDANGEKFSLMVFTPPIYTYAYDFLINWYGMKKYRYVPPSEKKGLLYLLIEKDEGEPWRHKGWLETVIKEGTIEKNWVLPSGFIIEKRRMP